MRIINLRIVIISCMVFVLFFGCIPVEKLDSKLWETAYLDSELTGHWKSDDSDIPYSADYVTFIKDGQSYKYCIEDTHSYFTGNDIPILKVRSHKINNIKLLVFKDIGNSINNAAKNSESNSDISPSPSHSVDVLHDVFHRVNNLILRYEVNDDVLMYYQLIPGALSRLISEGRLHGEVLKKSDLFEARLFNIDPNGLDALSEEKLWMSERKFQRIKGIGNDIDETRYMDTKIKIDIDMLTQNLPDSQIERLLDHLNSLPEWEQSNNSNGTRCRMVRWPFKIRHPAGKLSGWDYDSTNRRMENELSVGEEEQEIEKEIKSWYAMGSNLHYIQDVNDLNPFKEHYSVLIDPDIKEVDLRLWRDDQGLHSSIFIGRDKLWLEIRETSWYKDRRKTQQFITYMIKIFDELKITEN